MYFVEQCFTELVFRELYLEPNWPTLWHIRNSGRNILVLVARLNNVHGELLYYPRRWRRRWRWRRRRRTQMLKFSLKFFRPHHFLYYLLFDSSLVWLYVMVQTFAQYYKHKELFRIQYIVTKDYLGMQNGEYCPINQNLARCESLSDVCNHTQEYPTKSVVIFTEQIKTEHSTTRSYLLYQIFKYGSFSLSSQYISLL